jgi:hypothetical protein
MKTTKSPQETVKAFHQTPEEFVAYWTARGARDADPKRGKQVTERALFQRINRKLAHQSVRLKKCRRDSLSWHDLGDYYAVDEYNHVCSPGGNDLEAIGREVGALSEHEKLAA